MVASVFFWLSDTHDLLKFLVHPVLETSQKVYTESTPFWDRAKAGFFQPLVTEFATTLFLIGSFFFAFLRNTLGNIAFAIGSFLVTLSMSFRIYRKFHISGIFSLKHGLFHPNSIAADFCIVCGATFFGVGVSKSLSFILYVSCSYSHPE